MKLKSAIILLILSGIGCGSGAGRSSGNEAKSEGARTPEVKRLPVSFSDRSSEGAWLAPCHADPDRVDMSVIEVIEIRSQKLRFESRGYLGLKCQVPFLTEAESWEISFDDLSQEWKGELSVVQVRPESGLAASLLSQSEYCGETEWGYAKQKEFKTPLQCRKYRNTSKEISVLSNPSGSKIWYQGKVFFKLN